jgi:hypothetical protein
LRVAGMEGRPCSPLVAFSFRRMSDHVGGQGPGEGGHFHHVWPGATRANAEGRMVNAECRKS